MAIGDSIYQQYSGGKFTSALNSCRINRMQYLAKSVVRKYKGNDKKELVSDTWKCGFSSFGYSKIRIPAWTYLGQARYALAHKIAVRMDPSNSRLKQVLIPERDAFMRDLGIFQGLSPENIPLYAIEGELLKTPGTAHATVKEALSASCDSLIDGQDYMFDDRATRQEISDKWSQIFGLIGDPEINPGDWSNEVIKNKGLFQGKILRSLNEKVEALYQDHGIAGAQLIIDATINLLTRKIPEGSRPEGQSYFYIDYCTEMGKLLDVQIEQATC